MREKSEIVGVECYKLRRRSVTPHDENVLHLNGTTIERKNVMKFDQRDRPEAGVPKSSTNLSDERNVALDTIDEIFFDFSRSHRECKKDH